MTVKDIIHIEKMKHIYKYTKYPDKIPKDTRIIYDKLNQNQNERIKNKRNMNIQRYNKEIGKKTHTTTQMNGTN